MRTIGIVLAMIGAVAVSRAADGDVDRLPRLIAGLASSDYRERESAARALEQLGGAAVDGPPGDGLLIVGHMLVRRGQADPWTIPSPAPRVALIDGPGPLYPAQCAGSVRVRAVRPGMPFPVEVGNDTLVALQVTAEPRL